MAKGTLLDLVEHPLSRHHQKQRVYYLPIPSMSCEHELCFKLPLSHTDCHKRSAVTTNLLADFMFTKPANSENVRFAIAVQPNNDRFYPQRFVQYQCRPVR